MKAKVAVNQPDHTALVQRWARRVVWLVVTSPTPAAAAALQGVGDPELVDALASARDLGGHDAVTRLLEGLAPARVARVASELAVAIQRPDVLALSGLHSKQFSQAILSASRLVPGWEEV